MVGKQRFTHSLPGTLPCQYKCSPVPDALTHVPVPSFASGPYHPQSNLPLMKRVLPAMLRLVFVIISFARASTETIMITVFVQART